MSSRLFVLALVIAALPRVGAVCLHGLGVLSDPWLPDEEQYWSMAQSVAEGHGLQDELGYRATRMPLYPTFLSLFFGMPSARHLALGAQALFGALGGGFIAWLAWHIAPRQLRSTTALLAALFFGFDPFLVYFSTFLLTETLFTGVLCGFLALCWLTSDSDANPSARRWFLLGFLGVLCVYLRPAGAMLVLLCWGFVLIRRRFDKSSLAGVAGILVFLLASLLPWAIRNHQVTGKWTWLTNRIGISLYDGVRPGATGASDLGAIKQTGVSEPEWNDYFMEQSWKQMRNDPPRILRLAVVKFMRTWSFWPNAQDYQSIWIKGLATAWTALVLLTALWGLIRVPIRHAARILLVLPAVYFTTLHMLFVGSVRYRLPAMPLIEILSALAIASILARRREMQTAKS